MAQADAPDLATLIAEHHLPEISSSLKLDKHWADKLLRQGNALVMIDGFDEVATDQYEAVGAWIDKAVTTYGNSAFFLLTSRPVGYERYKNTQPWMPLEVKAFDDEQRDDFLRRWYLCQAKLSRPGRDLAYVKTVADKAADGLINQLEQRSELAKMADNPLLLCMIATFHRFRPSSELPRQRTKLYQGFCQMLLADRPESKGQPMTLPAEEAQAVLQGVAWAMVQKDTIAIPKTELIGLVQGLMARETDAKAAPQKFIQDVEDVSELFVKRESADEVEFAHRSFQEYLAAVEVKKQGRDQALVNLKEEWQGAVLFYAAQANPTALINTLLARGDRTSLALAYDCWLENPNRVPPDVFSALQKQCYGQLEQYMVEGNWKAADQYTYRLMIQVLGKSYGQGFTAKELLTFPCQDLLRIDGLWVKYSDGKFGFSVQKEIWVQCGGKLDGKWTSEAYESYKKFRIAVGWYQDDKFIGYENLEFNSTDSPLAHLPGWLAHLPIVQLYG
ncbi:GUN4 domain-containing protein [Leptothoe spongobia]|uniref:GUN4 domain-containing protein n=1 Tax=Leptothoe spongobia TAU-MAC 1115 TaxID=1967444 RepID=A0A947DDR6_9CYAN|nr:GUN4 domain-containing protein [Leptothoe spongobia]MBT9315202.1 GUN4 domain-containing protein [Leptothoe spongobia TAU-MAC 1115]